MIALTLYRDNLHASAANSTRAAAQAVARAAQRGPLPDPIPIPVAAGVPRVQVLDAAGKVVSGDPTSAHAPPMINLVRGLTGQVETVAHPANLPERRAAVIAYRTTSPSGPLTVVAAGSLDPADTKTARALDFSAALGAISLLAVAFVAWGTTGRTLRRVERLRTQVSGITTSGDLTQRVPDFGADELGHLASTLNEMLAAMSISAERQHRFVADAAHELRTPIAGLITSLDVAMTYPETIDHPSWLAELADGHHRLSRLANDLLVLASLDNRTPTSHQPVDLSGIVADGVRRAAPAGVVLQTGTVDHAIVKGNASQLTRVLANLVDNALRYARSTVEVSVVAQHDHAVLTVTDDGPGIPPSQRERIWDRFVRLNDDRSRAGGGTGLGLALVKELVQTHSGTVALTGSTGTGGSTFVVRLPLCPTQPSRVKTLRAERHPSLHR